MNKRWQDHLPLKFGAIGVSNMPFKSKKQETYLRINEPEIHKRWVDAYGHYAAEGEDLCSDCWELWRIETTKTQHCDECGEPLCGACGDIATAGCVWETIICNEPDCFDVHVEGCSSCLEYIEENEAESFAAEVRMCKTCGEHEESGYCESCDSCYGICECDDCDCYTCKGAESFSAESKVYQIPCFWSVSMTIPVEAESLEEACEKAYTEIEKHDMSKADYLEDSFEPDYWFARDLNEEDEE